MRTFGWYNNIRKELIPQPVLLLFSVFLALVVHNTIHAVVNDPFGQE